MLALAKNAPPVLALGLSGGGDSLALMHALRAAYPDIALHALIVNHGLRSQSADDAHQAASWAEAVGAHPHILNWDTPRTGQAHARAARHRLLAQKADTLGARVLCLGHTLDDRIETLRMRAGRPGPNSRLVGPGLLDASPAWPMGRTVTLARPFLGLRRADLRRYLDRLGVSWIDDPSNEDPSYERARLRQDPMAPSQEHDLILRSDEARLEREVTQGKAFSLTERAVQFAPWGGVRLARHAFGEGPLAVASKAAEAAILAVSGQEAAVGPGQLTAFLESLKMRRAWTGGGALLTHEGWLGRDPGASGRSDGQPAVKEQILVPGQEMVFDGRWQVHASEAVTIGVLGRTVTDLAADVPAVLRPGLACLSDTSGAILAIAGLQSQSFAEMEQLGAARIRGWLLPQRAPAWFDGDHPASNVRAVLAKPVR